jgi:inner membrane protein
MDNLTHTAVGLFLSRAGFNRLTPRATAILLLAANAPDVDVVSALGGSLNYLHYHRHWTHSLLAMPAIAAAVIALVRFAGRKPIRWWGAFAAAMAGVASHLLLDWTNVYGVRMLLPFSSQWLRLDLTNVTDLWIWTAVALGIAAPVLARLVGSEITSGAPRPRYPGRTAAILALLFILAYECGRGVLHARAVAMLDSRLYDGAAPVRVAAIPGFANPLRWRGLVETRGFYALADVDLNSEFDPSRVTVYQKPDPTPAIDAAQRLAPVREYLRFSQFPLWRVLPVPEPENGREVEVMDLRFGAPSAPRFVISTVFDAALRPLGTSFQFGFNATAKAD